jgi:hypothetical protein
MYKYWEFFENNQSSVLIDKGRLVSKTNNHLNCKLFTQLVTGVDDIFNLPKADNMDVGDILVWGRHGDNPPRHYSVFIGDGQVMEVEAWGEPMRIHSFDDVSDEYEGDLEIFRP